MPKDFYLYSGNDDQVVPLLSLGGHGVISVLANVMPVEAHNMVMEYLNGNIQEALRLQLATKPLIDALFIEVNPIPVKSALNYMGMNVGSLRLPLVDLSKASQIILKVEMKKLGLL